MHWKKIFCIAAIPLLILGLSWKLIATSAWRLSHQRHFEVAGQRVPIPFPWMLVRVASPAKIERFVSFWPTWSDEYAESVIEAMPVDQLALSDADWGTRNQRVLGSLGLENFERTTYKGGAVQCSQAFNGSTEVAYCRSKAHLMLTYKGPKGQLENAIDLMPSE